MGMVEVFFINGNRARFEKDKVAFQSADGWDSFVFDFTEGGECVRNKKEYGELLESGKALVNWAAVSFVRAANDEEGIE